MRTVFSIPLVVVGVLLGAASEAAAQEIRARAVDEVNRQAIPFATVLLFDADSVIAMATTGGDGFFRVRAAGPGRLVLAVRQPGFAEATRSLAFAGRDTTLDAFVLAPQAIALDSIAVTTRRRDPREFEAGFTRASYIVAGDRLRRMEELGGTVYTAAGEISGIRTWEYQTPGGRQVRCLESVRRATSFQAKSPGSIHCPKHVVLVLDGMQMSAAEDVLRTIPLSDLESVTYLSPTDAGFKYGPEASVFGALVLWTRGRGPFVRDERNRR